MSVRATPESLAGFHVEGSRTAAGTAAGVHFDHVRTAAGDLLHTLKGGSVADDHAPHPYLGSLVVVALLLALLLLLARFFGLIGSSKSSSGARPFLPAFDVEGGSSSTSDSRILPPSIAKAASTSDVAMLRAWVSDERCVIDAALSTDGTTALHHGARAGHANVVRLLLDHGADCLAVDTELRTPLHYVAAAGHGCAPRRAELCAPRRAYGCTLALAASSSLRHSPHQHPRCASPSARLSCALCPLW